MELDDLIRTRGSRQIGGAAIERAAREIGCAVDVVRAVLDVEAAGAAFRRDGTLERRFEPHVYDRGLWSLARSLSVGASRREQMLRDAFEAAPQRALEATSWGAPQIMGFHWRSLGYRSATALVEDMARSAGRQLDVLAAFIIAEGLDASLRAEDFEAFALGYNGSARVEIYAGRLRRALEARRGRAGWRTLGPGARGQAVAELQERLGIEPDGMFGPRTESAVKEYQRSRGLAVDGVVGAQTWRAMDDAEGAPDSAREAAPSALLEGVQDKAVAVGSVTAGLEGVGRLFEGPARDAFGWLVLAGAAMLLALGIWWMLREVLR